MASKIKLTSGSTTNEQQSDEPGFSAQIEQLNKKLEETQRDNEVLQAELGRRKDEISKLELQCSGLRGTNDKLNEENRKLNIEVNQIHQKPIVDPVDKLEEAYKGLIELAEQGKSIRRPVDPSLRKIILEIISMYYVPK